MRTKISILYRFVIAILSIVAVSGCDQMLDVEPPVSIISTEVVFKDEATATSAVTGMYAQMMLQQNFASGSYQSLGALAALSADEFANFKPTNVSAIQFYTNTLSPSNSDLLNLWTSAYQLIYHANSIIEKLPGSTGVTVSARNQLLGEAFFIRSFCHFYLVNAFGSIPLITTTDYEKNAVARKASVDEVYNQVIQDLIEAKNLMATTYATAGRVRPNRTTASALLARVYLYLKDWQNAEAEATEVIDNVDYTLEANLDNVFLVTSREAIWQLRQTLPDKNTWEGYFFILKGAPNYSYLTDRLVMSFEPNDARRNRWINSFTTSTQTFYFPFKYKISTGGPGSNPAAPVNEYSMVFRLAEQLLIRAEARAKLGKTPLALEDVNSVRLRSGLQRLDELNSSIAGDELVNAIHIERRHELFAEWGHRWFDLKRTDTASDSLAPIKGNWDNSDLLYPIPEVEIRKNPNLGL